jgi:hypothetical protein
VRAGRTIASGTLPVKNGKVSRKKVDNLRRGWYTLMINIRHDHKTKVLVKETLHVS